MLLFLRFLKNGQILVINCCNVRKSVHIYMYKTSENLFTYICIRYQNVISYYCDTDLVALFALIKT